MESSKKWHTCEKCAKKLSSYHSLWRHKKICRSSLYNVPAVSVIRDRSPIRSRFPDMSTLNAGFVKETRPTNPKIKSLLDEIINDNSTDKSQSTIPQSIPNNILPQKTTISKLPSTAADVLSSPPPTEVIAAVFQEKPEVIIDEILPPVKSNPRTKGDIIGFSDGDSDDSDSDESIDINDIKPKVKFLPSTIEGLCEQFHTLWMEFTRQGKHNNRNEIVFLLDELLRQEGITRDEYAKLNNILAESVGSGIDAEKSPKEEAMEVVPEYEDEDSSKEETDSGDNEETSPLKKLIQSTFEYSIQPDKKELMELIKDFRRDDDALDTVQELEELIEVHLLDEFIDKEPILEKLNAVRAKLEHSSSSISKVKQLRLKILLDDIVRNRHRVQSIIKRTADVMGEKEEMAFMLKQLAGEELLSEEQYLKLAQMDMDELNSSRLADVIKETKIGQGMHFLPRKLSDLTKQLHIWLEEFAKSKESAVQKKVIAVLNELLRRKDITQECYTAIKEDNDIV